MITKKKGLYLGLLVSMLGMGNVMQAQRYTYTTDVSIRNDTPYPIKYSLYLAAARDRYGEIGPGKTAKIPIGNYLIEFVGATVQRPDRPAVKAKLFRVLGDIRSTNGRQIMDWNKRIRPGDRKNKRYKSFVISGSDKTGYTVLFKSKS